MSFHTLLHIQEHTDVLPSVSNGKLSGSFLDKLVRPEVQIFRKRMSSYQVCGYTGLILGVLLGMTLAAYRGLSLWTLGCLTGTGMLTFLGLVMITKIITGEEQIIYYHHEIAIMIMSGLFLNLLNQPVLPYLDLTILGIGTFLACGRVGCLMVGCCHGKPHKWGVCYKKEHADAGFTHYYVGIRLFPIQALESLWVLFLVIVGTILVLGKHPAGEALAWYVINYDIGRFVLEFFRGDPERPYYWGYSEGQWISIVLMGAVIWGESIGVLTFHLWHVIATAAIVSIMIVVALARKFQGTLKYQIFLPRHVKEVAEAVQRVSHASAGVGENIQNIPVVCTSLGIRISTQTMENDGNNIRHFAISSQKEKMTERSAMKLADLIMKLKYSTGSGELIKGNRGVFHLLIHPLGPNNGELVMKQQTLYAQQDDLPDLRQEIINGLLYTHGRLNANTQLAFEAQCQLAALTRLLCQKDIITAKELEEQEEIAGRELGKVFQERELGVMIQNPTQDKYNLKEKAVKFDCAKRIHLCRAACCRLSFALSGQDVQEGIVRWNLGRPYMIVHQKDGYCSHLDRETLTCTIYKRQPVICQTYHCRNDKRIWVDFDNMVINPEIIRSDWPYCIKPKKVENETHVEKTG